MIKQTLRIALLGLLLVPAIVKPMADLQYKENDSRFMLEKPKKLESLWKAGLTGILGGGLLGALLGANFVDRAHFSNPSSFGFGTLIGGLLGAGWIGLALAEDASLRNYKVEAINNTYNDGHAITKGLNLHGCAASNNAEGVRYHLRKHPSAIHDNRNYTPLMYAAANGANDSLKALLNAYPRLNIQDNQGSTALHFALYNHHNDAVALLIEAGARVDIKDGQGKTALQILRQRKYIPNNVIVAAYKRGLSLKSGMHRQGYALTQVKAGYPLISDYNPQRRNSIS